MGLKYRVNEEFFNTWSIEMAYVLGYLVADGNMQNAPSIRAKYISFCSTDHDRVELIAKLMNAEHISYVRKGDATHKDRYDLKIGSHKLFDQLQRLGITPKKSHTAIFPDVPLQYLPGFILGYFDGDGCAFIERIKNGSVKKLLAIFTCASFEFISQLQKLLSTEASMTPMKIYNHGSTSGAYQLRYSTRDSIRLFQYLYNSPILVELAMKRKYDIFKEYFSIRGISEEDFPNILKQKGPVVKRKHDGLQTHYARVRFPPGPP